MSAFIRLAFICIPGAEIALALWAAIFGISAPAWMVNMAGVVGTLAAAALAYEYKQRRQ